MTGVAQESEKRTDNRGTAHGGTTSSAARRAGRTRRRSSRNGCRHRRRGTHTPKSPTRHTTAPALYFARTFSPACGKPAVPSSILSPRSPHAPAPLRDHSLTHRAPAPGDRPAQCVGATVQVAPPPSSLPPSPPLYLCTSTSPPLPLPLCLSTYLSLSLSVCLYVCLSRVCLSSSSRRCSPPRQQHLPPRPPGG